MGSIIRKLQISTTVSWPSYRSKECIGHAYFLLSLHTYKNLFVSSSFPISILCKDQCYNYSVYTKIYATYSLDVCGFLISLMFLLKFWKFSAMISSNILSASYSFSSSGTLMMWMLHFLWLSHRSLKYCFLF